MKNICLFLLLIFSCSTTKFYNVSDLHAELERNAQQLDYIEQSVSSDFSRKLELYEKFSPRLKASDFLSHELSWRLKELATKKRFLLQFGARIKRANMALIRGIAGRETVSDADPIFEKIEDFGDKTAQEAQGLYSAFDEYRSASASFTKIMLFSRSSLQVKNSQNLKAIGKR